MSKICTDLKQSRKLVELGLDPNTADMMYLYRINSKTKQEGIEDIPTVREELPIQKGDVPAWSLPVLLELIPNYRIESNELGMHKCLCKGHHTTNVCNNPLDAVFEMMCWILENGFIKKEQ